MGTDDTADCVGLESTPSGEVPYSVPGLNLAITASSTNGFPAAVHVIAFGSPPAQWTLQQSTDRQSWQTLKCGTNCPTDATVDATAASYRFFRLVTPWQRVGFSGATGDPVGMEVSRALGGRGPRCQVFLLRKKGKIDPDIRCRG